jgi:hypothetical protein
MKTSRLFLTTLLCLAGLGVARAAELAGKWTAEFDTQIGVQKYVYEFKADGDKLTGKATYENSMGKGEVALRDVKVNGDDVGFVEPLNFDGNELLITYSGKLAGDAMKLTRQVGDFATEHIEVKRAAAAAAKPAAGK